MLAMRKVPKKLFSKTVVSKGYGFHTPQDGSVCKIKVILDEANLLTGVGEDQTKEIIVGDVDETIDRIIEDCIRTMKEEEECCIEFQHPDTNTEIIIPVESDAKNDVTEFESVNETGKNLELEVDSNTKISASNSKSTGNIENEEDNIENESGNKKENESESNMVSETEVTETEEADVPNVDNSDNLVKVQFQLLTYTREPEIWEMSITEKWRRASYHKQRGLDLYARGVYQYAFRRFGLTLKYVVSLEHDIPSGQEEGMDIKGLKLSCYLNVAACQMRHHNYQSVVANSSKALDLQPDNAKALYRRGAAYLQLQEYEKAKEDLLAAQKLEPKNQAIAKQLQVLKTRVQKLNQYYASAMKKMFS